MNVVPFYEGRDYVLFAKLAGVRDYWNEIPKIDNPRGLPDNISNITLAEYKEWEGDAHTMSWLSAKEIFDNDVEDPKEITGWLYTKHAEELDKGILPEYWIPYEENDTILWENHNRVLRTWTHNFSPIKNFSKALRESIIKESFYGYTGSPDFEERFEKEKEHYRVIFWFDN